MHSPRSTVLRIDPRVLSSSSLAAAVLMVTGCATPRIPDARSLYPVRAGEIVYDYEFGSVDGGTATGRVALVVHAISEPEEARGLTVTTDVSWRLDEGGSPKAKDALRQRMRLPPVPAIEDTSWRTATPRVHRTAGAMDPAGEPPAFWLELFGELLLLHGPNEYDLHLDEVQVEGDTVRIATTITVDGSPSGSYRFLFVRGRGLVRAEGVVPDVGRVALTVGGS